MDAFTWSIALLFALASCQPPPPAQTITRNGMTVSWTVGEGYLDLSMSAPATGWVAVGFNPQDQLAGTSLIMGRIRDEQAEAVDHYVRSPGDYLPVRVLGGRTAISHTQGNERKGMTSLTFRLTLNPGDEWHHHLIAGQPYYLLMAYSLDDDFGHHSVMRTSVFIHL